MRLSKSSLELEIIFPPFSVNDKDSWNMNKCYVCYLKKISYVVHILTLQMRCTMMSTWNKQLVLSVISPIAGGSDFKKWFECTSTKSCRTMWSDQLRRTELVKFHLYIKWIAIFGLARLNIDIPGTYLLPHLNKFDESSWEAKGFTAQYPIRKYRQTSMTWKLFSGWYLSHK